MKKKQPGRTVLASIKRGATSLFVCAAVILPAATMFEWSHAFGRPGEMRDTRTTAALPSFNPRAIDQTTARPDLFDQPLITVTFDDGWESIYVHAMPLLNKYGIRSTQYIIAGTSKDNNYVSDFQVREMLRTGHELDGHTFSHADLPTKSDTGLQLELVKSQQNLRQRFGQHMFDDLASPYGHTDDRVLAAVQKNYRSHRNTDGDYYNGMSQYDVNLAGSFDRYNIIGMTIRHDTTVEDLQKMVEFTVANNGWLVLNYHAVDDDESTFAVDQRGMEAQLRYLANTKVRIVTMGQVLDTIALEGQEY